eukprot:jgi/Chrzof1/12605/Cz07g00210.t1
MDQATFYCQLCRTKLNLRGDFDSFVEQRRADQVGALNTSVLDTSRIDESFIVLDNQRQGGPPHPRTLDESFVVLGSASLLRPVAGTQPTAAAVASTSGRDAGGSGAGAAAGSSSSAAAGTAGLDGKLQALKALFELASTATVVDHPLCLDCAAQLKEEVEAQVAETEREIAAYSEALARLEAEPAQTLIEEDFEQEMSQIAADTDAMRQRTAALEAELAAVARDTAALEAVAADMDAKEERYWHEFNEYQLALTAHVKERDALLNRIDRGNQRLQLLKSTNVLNDAFRIWHDGAFGTISGFRLGRTPEVHVEWDEINAAWGQAVLLLHTMAQSCKLNFSAYRLLPMGSHPRVADKRSTYDLFGPVNKLWSANYDKAMVCYLACLKEFGDFARARDVSEGKQQPFEFPFPVEGDKVGNYTIKLSMLNKDVKWTKALKLMLANLKVALQWMIRRDMMAVPQLPSLGLEGPASQPLMLPAS